MMRMWRTNPKNMCRQHLLGEHGELHKHRHNFIKKHKMHKRIKLCQIDAYNMQKRHDLLAKEMLRRGYKHNSPYIQPDINYLPKLKGILECSSNKCGLCKKMIKKEKCYYCGYEVEDEDLVYNKNEDTCHSDCKYLNEDCHGSCDLYYGILL